jgi:hypothetical protein
MDGRHSAEAKTFEFSFWSALHSGQPRGVPHPLHPPLEALPRRLGSLRKRTEPDSASASRRAVSPGADPRPDPCPVGDRYDFFSSSVPLNPFLAPEARPFMPPTSPRPTFPATSPVFSATCTVSAPAR